MKATTTDHSGHICEVFWGEIAPSEHLVQIYPNDSVFLDTLEGFVSGGLQVGESVVVIATPEHLDALNERLTAAGIKLDELIQRDQYIALDADRTLKKFMFRGWPDDILFASVVGDLLKRASAGGRRVRAFGEMVALLWTDGHTGATVRLEHLWHQLCQQKGFSLFCAYPRIGFTQDADMSIREICAAHSKTLTA
jgi:hypothetical protein